MGLGCRGDVQGLQGKCARVVGEMCKSCRGDVQGLLGRCAKVAGEMCKGAKVKSTPSPRLSLEFYNNSGAG